MSDNRMSSFNTALCKIGKHWEPATILSIFIKSWYNQTQAAQNCLLSTQTLFLARTGQIKVPGQAQVQILITDPILEKEDSPEGVPVAAMVNFRFGIFSSEPPKDL